MNHFLALLFAVATATAHAAPDRIGPAALTADELKVAYLDCERLATAAFLGGADAANCSLIHEELKERVFGGDFARLLAWWQAQRHHGREGSNRIGAAW